MKGKTVKGLAVLAVLAAAAYWAYGAAMRRADASVADASRYQAVFLTNGQAYFGKASNVSGQYIRLENVYYLVINRPLQNQSEGEEQKDGPKYTLMKLGQELHGPDSMSINRDQVLFIENLKEDSKVMAAIKGGQK
jgi:hypothetical protein